MHNTEVRGQEVFGGGNTLEEKARYEEQKRLAHLQGKRDSAEVDIYRQERMAGIAMQKEFLSAEQRADIASAKELQRTVVYFERDGNAFLHKEQFGVPIKGALAVKVLDACVICHDADLSDEILSVHLEKSNGKDANLFFDLRRMEPRHFRCQFEKNGISFGFGRKKEDEVRRKLVMALVQAAQRIVVPETYGWHLVGEKWGYALPGKCAWKEVIKWL